MMVTLITAIGRGSIGILTLITRVMAQTQDYIFGEAIMFLYKKDGFCRLYLLMLHLG